MYGIYEDLHQGKFIVMEYMEERSLDKFLQIRKDEIKLIDLIDFSCQVSLGMIYLSEKSIIHRDLAARYSSFFFHFKFITIILLLF